MKSLITIFLFSTLTLIQLSKAESNSSAPKVEASKQTAVSGKIKEVDGQSHVLRLTDASSEVHNFNITSSTKVTVNGSGGKLEDLGPGMDVSVVPAEYAMNADSVSATGTPPQKPNYNFGKKKAFADKKKKK